MSASRPSAAAALVLASLAALASGCDRATAQDKPGSKWAMDVEVVKARRQDVLRESTLPIQLYPWQRTELLAKVTGYVQSIPADRGTKIKKGDLLAKLWVPELEQQIEEVKNEIQITRWHLKGDRDLLKGVEAWRDHAKRVAERGKALVPERGMQQQECDRLVAEHLKAEAEVDLIKCEISAKEHRIEILGYELKRLEALFDYTNIRAPFDGVVTERHVHEGMLVEDTKATRIFDCVQSTTIRATIDVPEYDSPFIKEGTPVRMQLLELGQQWMPGTVSRVSNVVDHRTRTLRVEADYKNPDGKLLPGMFGQVTLTLENHKNALTVPSGAILKDGANALVWVIDGEVAKSLPVKVGLDDGKAAEILEGLTDDQEVIAVAKGVSKGLPVQKKKEEPKKEEPKKP